MKNDPIELLAAHMGLDAEFLRECLRRGALDPEEFPEDPLAVPPARLARLRRLHRLCLSLEVDAFAGAIIVDLLERLDEARGELRRRP